MDVGDTVGAAVDVEGISRRRVEDKASSRWKAVATMSSVSIYAIDK